MCYWYENMTYVEICIKEQLYLGVYIKGYPFKKKILWLLYLNIVYDEITNNGLKESKKKKEGYPTLLGAHWLEICPNIEERDLEFWQYINYHNLKHSSHLQL